MIKKKMMDIASLLDAFGIPWERWEEYNLREGDTGSTYRLSKVTNLKRVVRYRAGICNVAGSSGRIKREAGRDVRRR